MHGIGVASGYSGSEALGLDLKETSAQDRTEANTGMHGKRGRQASDTNPEAYSHGRKLPCSCLWLPFRNCPSGFLSCWLTTGTRNISLHGTARIKRLRPQSNPHLGRSLHRLSNLQLLSNFNLSTPSLPPSQAPEGRHSIITNSTGFRNTTNLRCYSMEHASSECPRNLWPAPEPHPSAPGCARDLTAHRYCRFAWRGCNVLIRTGRA